MLNRGWRNGLVALVLILVALSLAGMGEAAPLSQDNPPAEQPRLVNIRGERLLGLPILNREGEQIGEVGDLLVSFTGHRQSGNPERPARGGLIANARVDYVLAQYGGVLGWDKESVPVPLTALRLHLVDGERLGFDDDLVYFEGTDPGDNVLQDRKTFFDGNALVLPGQEDLDGVPEFDLDGVDDIDRPAWDRSLRAYWEGLGTAWPQGIAENGTAYRVSSVRELNRFSLRELAGDGLGWIDDVLLTLAVANPVLAPVPALPQGAGGVDGNGNDATDGNDNRDADDAAAANRALAASLPIVDGRVHYALVGHGGWWGWGGRTSPAPVGALMLDRDYDERTAYLEADDDLLEDAPALEGKQATELNDDNFFNRVRAFWQEAGWGPFER